VEEDVQLDPSKLMEALRKEDQRLKAGGAGAGEEGDGGSGGERKRGYHVDHEVLPHT
jgi:pre-mRNA-processing factor SLU7